MPENNCDVCGGIHLLPQMLSQWKRWAEGFRDGMDGRSRFPHSDPYRIHGYEAGYCAGRQAFKQEFAIAVATFRRQQAAAAAAAAIDAEHAAGNQPREGEAE